MHASDQVKSYQHSSKKQAVARFVSATLLVVVFLFT